MTMEIEDYQKREAYLYGKIRSLEFLLNLAIATMPESHRDSISRRLSNYAHRSEEQAARMDTDDARDQASAIYDTNSYFEAYLEDEADIFHDRE